MTFKRHTLICPIRAFIYWECLVGDKKVARAITNICMKRTYYICKVSIQRKYAYISLRSNAYRLRDSSASCLSHIIYHVTDDNLDASSADICEDNTPPKRKRISTDRIGASTCGYSYSIACSCGGGVVRGAIGVEEDGIGGNPWGYLYRLRRR
ncbi:Hypothetical predicted protein [Octopus vulgaris]|uniref:Uncharacterized protein n=1 Tax=Octopus vulgaris TaxID=6645 RepID=A0AA36AZG3_OCTVU|nr:Hypothetical predicted protein [Octopus vulgaris]